MTGRRGPRPLVLHLGLAALRRAAALASLPLAQAGPALRLAGDAAALRARIDGLERRLAALEAGPGGDGADRRGPRRRRPPA